MSEDRTAEECRNLLIEARTYWGDMDERARRAAVLTQELVDSVSARRGSGSGLITAFAGFKDAFKKLSPLFNRVGDSADRAVEAAGRAAVCFSDLAPGAGLEKRMRMESLESVERLGRRGTAPGAGRMARGAIQVEGIPLALGRGERGAPSTRVRMACEDELKLAAAASGALVQAIEKAEEEGGWLEEARWMRAVGREIPGPVSLGWEAWAMVSAAETVRDRARSAAERVEEAASCYEGALKSAVVGAGRRREGIFLMVGEEMTPTELTEMEESAVEREVERGRSVSSERELRDWMREQKKGGIFL